MDKLKYIVYITINQCNGKFYIGVHRTNPEVFDGYIGCGIYRPSNIKKNLKGFHGAVKKYGYHNFKRTTIAAFDDTEEGMLAAYKLESLIVTKELLSSKSVYNISLGGKGCSVSDYKTIYMFDLTGKYIKSFKSSMEAARSLEVDNLISALHNIRNVCLGSSKSAFNYYWSYEKKFSFSNEKRRKIALYTASGKFIRIYDSISEAQLELTTGNISQAIKKGGLAAGYQWRYYEGNTSDIESLVTNSNKNKVVPIEMYDILGKFLKQYESILHCVDDTGLSASLINRVLKHIIKSHKGFIFKMKI